MADEMDNIEEFDARNTAKVLPSGWLLLFIGLIIFGIFYTVAYTPEISGWSQEKVYEESLVNK
jgi:hypothetical protein